MIGITNTFPTATNTESVAPVQASLDRTISPSEPDIADTRSIRAVAQTVAIIQTGPNFASCTVPEVVAFAFPGCDIAFAVAGAV